MATLKTYDLKGNKQSFANWISNLSPCETPFASMIGKEKVDQTQYSWQIDRLSKPAHVGVKEGAAFVAPDIGNAEGEIRATVVKTDFTQILRKVVRVTDTANKVGLYGRASELAYQMEKAGMEIKRDLELMLLTNGVGNIGTSGAASKFSGFAAQCAAKTVADVETGAITTIEHKPINATAPAFDLNTVHSVTYNLYLAGSKANKIMVHPKHMGIFSDILGFSKNLHTHRMFDNLDTRMNMHIGKIRDPLGQDFEIIPNRYMPEDQLFFFNEKDWTQMILREPAKTELAKNGSAEKHMIEMEVGLRHRHPYASGVLILTPFTALPFEEKAEVAPKAKVKAKAE